MFGFLKKRMIVAEVDGIKFYKTRAGEPNPFRVGVKASPLADERKI